tara:strand:- start:141 stop:1202 length:1062 start_codon:yes stop_codon:yes gene_type:complete
VTIKFFTPKFIRKKKDLGVFYLIHLYRIMDEKKTPKKYGKKKVKYYCEKCDFLSSNKKDYTRHLKTKKHLGIKKKPQNSDFVDFECVFCDKHYKSKSALKKHQRKCKKLLISIVDPVDQKAKNPKNDINLKTEKKLKEKLKELEKEKSKNSKDELIMTMIKQQSETMELLKQSIKTTQEMSKNVGNNNNNTISINLFLNENCKNAMNLTDFIQNMNVSLEDLEFSKDNGFVKGVTNIFTKQLQDLDPTERPIHCSDKKRLQFYVKEDDVWTKDTNNEKIDRTITNIKIKQVLSLTEWEKENPNFLQDPVLLDKWQYMMANMSAIEGKEKASKNIARNIAEVINIKDAMPKKIN